MTPVRFGNDKVLFTPGDKVAFGCELGCCAPDGPQVLPRTIQVDVTVDDWLCDCSSIRGRFYVDFDQAFKEAWRTQWLYTYRPDEEQSVCPGDLDNQLFWDELRLVFECTYIGPGRQLYYSWVWCDFSLGGGHWTTSHSPGGFDCDLGMMLHRVGSPFGAACNIPDSFVVISVP